MVRFHPPELFNLNPCVLGRAAKVSDFQSGEAGSIPAGHSCDLITRVSANGKPAAFEAVVCRFDSFRPCFD